jgi:hypothetical protein
MVRSRAVVGVAQNLRSEGSFSGFLPTFNLSFVATP